jgi:3-oxoacyl-[acyl-carrier-protein] synthase-3
MNSMTQAYITGVGAYLPGDPIDNQQLADRFGDATARDATLRQRALAANGIRTRHYAVNSEGLTVMLNEELAAHAAQRALADRGLTVSAVRMLAAGTTQGDVLVPGFASMVHGRLGGGPMELLSVAGVCASGMAALKGAVSAVRLGEHPVAVAVGSELVSRSFGIAPADTPDTIFLRWTLSDGAGAVVVEPQPRPDRLSLRVDWMHLVSHAHEHPVCMSAGLDEDRTPRAGATWLDRRPGRPVEVPRLRQDMSVLPDLIDVGIAEFCSLVRAGRIDPGTEHILCHYSAEHFRAKLFGRLCDAGYPPDEQRWFTNLHTAGNTGAASIFVMLADARSRLRPGDRVLLIVPESARFTLAFAHLTCVGPAGGPSPAELAASPLGPPEPGDDPVVSRAFSELAQCGRNSSRPWPGCPWSGGSRTARRRWMTTAGSWSTCASRSWTAAGGSRWPPRTSRRSCSGCAGPRSSTPPTSTVTSRCWSVTSRPWAGTPGRWPAHRRTSARRRYLPLSSTAPGCRIPWTCWARCL